MVVAALAATACRAKTVEIVSGGDIAAAITEATSDDTTAEVVLGAGDYAPAATITLDKAVTVRGATGNPGDVRVSGGTRKAFSLDNASAQLRDLVVENCVLSSINQDGIAVYVAKGVISNCVVRNCRDRKSVV